MEKEKYGPGRQTKKSPHPTHSDYKLTETEIFEPSAIQIIVTSNSGVEINFSENLSYSNIESRD
jgi:hypothetical protein